MFFVETRLAQPNDLPELFRMIQSLAVYEKISDQVLISLSELEQALFSENLKAYAYIAFVNEKAAGYVLLVPSPYIKRGQDKLIIEDFYVDEAFRGNSLGRHLMQAAIEFARDNKHFKIEWAVYNWNQSAQQFYQRMGAEPATTWTSYSYPVSCAD